MTDKATIRTSVGLRDTLFEELDNLRNGKSSPSRASAVSKLAVQIINSAKMEVEYQKHVASNQGITLGQGAPLKLGTIVE